MKLKFIIISLIFSSLNAFSQQLEIANWFGNKKSATVFTFDDWSPGQYSFLSTVATNKQLPFSVYVTIANAWQSDAYNKMSTMINAGCEIGNHTSSHPQLTNSSNLKLEIRDVYNELNRLLPNQKVTTLAYPFGDFNQRVIDSTKILHIAARTVDSSLNNWGYNFVKTNNDYYKIPTQEVNYFVGTKGMLKAINQGIENGGLVTLMYHSIYSFSSNVYDFWFDPIHIDTLNKMFDLALEKRTQTWVTTLSNAVKYHKEKNSATLNLISSTYALNTYQLTDTLSDNNMFNHPLTLNYTLGNDENIDSIVQKQKLTFTKSNGKITFNAIPDGGEIKMYKQSKPVGIADKTTLSTVNIYPNPGKGYAYIQSDAAFDSNVSIKIFDLQGLEITDFEIENVNTNTIKLKTNIEGLYFLKLSNLQSSEIYKIKFGE